MTGHASNTLLMKGLEWLSETITDSADSFMSTDRWSPKIWITVNGDIPATCEDVWSDALARREIYSEELHGDEHPILFLPAVATDGMILPIGAIGSIRGERNGTARFVCIMKRQAQDNEDEPFLYEMLYIASIPVDEGIMIEENVPVLINAWCIKNYAPEAVEEES